MNIASKEQTSHELEHRHQRCTSLNSQGRGCAPSAEPDKAAAQLGELRQEQDGRQLQILFITSALSEGPTNQNHHQRLRILARSTALTILAPRGSVFRVAEADGARIRRPLLPGRLGVAIESLLVTHPGLRGRNFDLVVTDPSALGICGLVGKWSRPSMRWVVDVWDIPFRQQAGGLLSRIWAAVARRSLRRAYRHADLFLVSIVPGLELAWYQIPEPKLARLSNAIWLNQQSPHPSSIEPPGKPQNILCMRSVHTRDMGLDTLSQAFKILVAKNSEVTLTVIGRIPREISQQLRDIQGHHNVELAGYLDHEEVMKRIEKATVCVIPFKDVPDLAQTYPIKVLEYLHLGKPVVASNLVGIASMIKTRHNGILFRPGDAVDLAAKIGELLENTTLRQNLAANAARIDPRHDAAVKGQQILGLLTHLVHANRKQCLQ